MSKIQAVLRKHQYGSVTGIIIVTLFSVILANSTIASFQSPINVAVAGAVSPIYASSIFIGSLITYFLTGKVYLSSIHIFALLLVVISRWMFYGRTNSYQSAAITAVCMAFSSIVVGMAVGYDKGITAVFLCISVLTGLATFFILEVVEDYKKNKIFLLNGTSGCALAVLYILTIITISSLSLSIINIGRILGTFVILTATKRYKHIGGSICGILTSTGVMIYSKDLGATSVLLGASGLVTGFFSEFGKLTIAFFFIAINAVGLMLLGVNEEAFRMELDIILGSFIFVYAPTVSINKLFVRTNEAEEYIARLVFSRLDFMTNSLMSVRKNAESIAKMLNKKKIKNDIGNEVCERVCSKCRNKLICWENNYEKTNESFNRMAKKRNISISTATEELENCIDHKGISDEFNAIIREKFQQKIADAKLKEMQNLLFEQMKISEQIILSSCQNISERINYDNTLTKQIANLLDRENVVYNNVVAYFTVNDKLIIEIYFENKYYKLDANEICSIISAEVDKNMECYEPVYAGDEVKVIISEAPKYKVVCSYEKSDGADGSKPSGDSCEYFYDGYGNIYLVISDGMGTGRQASIESKMVISHFKRLIKAGVEYKLAIKIVNTLMLSKSSDENFATLDISQINLESGKLKLIKSGASSTLIKRGDTLTMIHSPSLPIGIISDIEPFEKEVNFEEDDILVMLSDGVDESEYKNIKQLLLSRNKSNLKSIVGEICKKAQNSSTDDVTVMMAKIYKN
ncbi:MAG: SpoIIE family protein phosphatase [Clostridiales bacterium]|jgi:stage II sporulation protein E|nr:SpoIIE family protein phosphatase [Clostridiales bacterium]